MAGLDKRQHPTNARGGGGTSSRRRLGSGSQQRPGSQLPDVRVATNPKRVRGLETTARPAPEGGDAKETKTQKPRKRKGSDDKKEDDDDSEPDEDNNQVRDLKGETPAGASSDDSSDVCSANRSTEGGDDDDDSQGEEDGTKTIESTSKRNEHEGKMVGEQGIVDADQMEALVSELISSNLWKFVQKDIFPKQKFGLSDEDNELVCLLFMKSKWFAKPFGVNWEDKVQREIYKVRFVSQWRRAVPKIMNSLRKNCVQCIRNHLKADFKKGKLPKNLPEGLKAHYRDYFDCDGKFKNKGRKRDWQDFFCYFIDRVLPAINCKVTEFGCKGEGLKHREFDQVKLSSHFTSTDEAFALWILINYWERWMELFRRETTGKSQPLPPAKYTTSSGSKKGFDNVKVDGRKVFDQLCKKIDDLRGNHNTGEVVEKMWRKHYQASQAKKHARPSAAAKSSCGKKTRSETYQPYMDADLKTLFANTKRKRQRL